MSDGRVLLMSDYRRRHSAGSSAVGAGDDSVGLTRSDAASSPSRDSTPARDAGSGQAALSVPSLARSRGQALTLGASQETLATVTRAAVAFTRWRLVQDLRGDFAFHATRWSLLSRPERSLLMPCGGCPAGPMSSAESAAVRWATARLAHLLSAGLPMGLAVDEAVAIPMEATEARLMTRDQWEILTRFGQWPPERDNVVADTVPVWALTAAEFRLQRLVARRILTLTASGGTHDGWFTLPSAVATQHGWQVVAEAESGRGLAAR